jgi:hypothetical protein
MTFIALGVSAAAAREVPLTTGSFTGDGEAVSVAWRFWPQRPRYAVGLHAPARWGGVWGLDAFAERQPFSLRAVQPERVQARTGARLSAADWATAHVRWEFGAGVESWKEGGTFGTGSLALRAVSRGARADGRLRLTTWSGKRNFSTGELALRLRSSTDLSGGVLVAGLYAAAASHAAPWDLWFAGDTGHARPVLLRAHPILDEGRLRVAQLGRRLEAASVEAQWWRRTSRGLRVGAAVFGDFARTADRVGGDARRDADAGIGARLALPGLAGTLRLDLAKGLRDGATALSLVYEP